MSKKNKLFANVIEWVLILLFGSFSLFLWTSSKKITNGYENNKVVRERVVNALSDSIRTLKSKPTIFKYRYAHDGDTIYVNRKLEPLKGDVYFFSEKDGSISYQIIIKAKDVSWYKVKINVDDDQKIKK